MRSERSPKLVEGLNARWAFVYSDKLHGERKGLLTLSAIKLSLFGNLQLYERPTSGNLGVDEKRAGLCWYMYTFCIGPGINVSAAT